MADFLSMLAVTPKPDASAPIVIHLTWGTVTAALGLLLSTIGVGFRWIWTNIIVQRETEIRERYGDVISGKDEKITEITKDRDDAVKARDDLQDEYLRKTLPLIERADGSLTELANTEATTTRELADSVRLVTDEIASMREAFEKVRKTVRANTAVLKNHNCADRGSHD